MKYLLDTCTFLWIISANKSLSAKAKSLFQNPENEIYLSSISAWEIAVKFQLKKLPLPKVPADFIPEQRKLHQIHTLEFDEDSALKIVKLPPLHRDPFDRALIAQSIQKGLVLLTPDPLIRQYPVAAEW